jgi:hypothetical protein
VHQTAPKMVFQVATPRQGGSPMALFGGFWHFLSPFVTGFARGAQMSERGHAAHESQTGGVLPVAARKRLAHPQSRRGAGAPVFSRFMGSKREPGSGEFSSRPLMRARVKPAATDRAISDRKRHEMSKNRRPRQGQNHTPPTGADSIAQVAKPPDGENDRASATRVYPRLLTHYWRLIAHLIF